MTSSSCISPSDPSFSTSWFSQFWQPLAMLHVTELAIARALSTDIFCSLTFALRYLHQADRCRVLLHRDGFQQSVFDFPPSQSTPGRYLASFGFENSPYLSEGKLNLQSALKMPSLHPYLLTCYCISCGTGSLASFNFSLTQF